MFNFSEKVDTSDSEDNAQILEYLRQIRNGIGDLYFHITEINDSLQATLSEGKESIQQRKRLYLINVYSKYLVSEGLSNDEALKRAKFEVCSFDNEKLGREIERKILDKEKEVAENEFFNSKTIEKDIEDFWTISQNDVKRIGEYDLFAPIYELYKSTYSFDVTKPIKVCWEADDDYYSFIKNRAIIRNLEQLGILSKVTSNKKDRDLKNQNYRLMVTDLDKIGEIIYKGPTHGNDFFDERLAKNELPKIFETDIFYQEVESQ